MLAERYRPTDLADVVGQERAVAQVRRVLERGWGGRAWWITGTSGTGKSALARIIASVGADDFYVEKLDAQLLTPARLRDVEADMRFRAMSAKPGKAYIVNEAHGLRRDAIQLLLVILERLPALVCIVFTTTKSGQASLFEDMGDDGDAAPLVSRCIELVLESGPEARKAMAMRAKAIARREGIDGLPDSVYLDAVEQTRGNMRMLLSRIESGQFAEDAKYREGLRRELAMIGSTKGEAAEERRQRIRELLAK
jgi:replication-associated recombination protein RarA